MFIILILISIFSCQLFNTVSAVDHNRSEPAFKIRITRQGLDYANEIASNILNEEIRKLNIPNIVEGDTKLRNIRVTSFRPPAYSYNLTPPSTFTWGLQGAGIELAANAHGCKRVGFKICKSLDVRTDANNVSVRVSAKFGRQSNGKPTIVSVDCQASIGNFDLKVKGGLIGWIINIFRNQISRKLRPQMERRLCNKAKHFLLTNVNRKLASFPVQTKIGRFFKLDCGLLTDPEITNDFIEVALKGQIIQSNNASTEISPYTPVHMPQVIKENRMMYAWASDTILNDIFFFLHQANLSRILLTRDTPQFGPFLKLQCERINKTKCIGSEIPDAVEKFASNIDAAEFLISTSAPPTVSIQNGQAYLNVNGTMELYVRPDNTSDTKYTIALASMNLEANLQISVENTSLIGFVNITELKIRIIKSQLDFMDIIKFEAGFPMMIRKLVAKQVNQRLAKGLPIPMTKGIDLIKPQIRLLEQTVQVESDVVYTR